MSKNSNIDHNLFLLIVGILAWLVPGAGHLAIKEKKRAAVIFITITSLFMTGLYIGSIGIVDHIGSLAWYIAQVMVSPAVFILGNITSSGKYPVSGHPQDIGQIYTCVAGLLNLLCILSAVYMAHSGRGEVVGEDEQ